MKLTPGSDKVWFDAVNCTFDEVKGGLRTVRGVFLTTTHENWKKAADRIAAVHIPLPLGVNLRPRLPTSYVSFHQLRTSAALSYVREG